jgi:hypothetical protein
MQTRFVAAGAVLSFVVCVSPAAAQGGSNVPNPSGFLKDYSSLEPVAGREGRYSWSVPEAELGAYKTFLLPPMEAWIDRDAQYRGLPSDVVERLAATYQSSFRQVLAPEYPVVDKPGAGVAACRFALTGLTPERPAMTPVDVLPIKAIFNVVRTASGTSSKVARISAELECSDSLSGRLLLQAVVTGAGDHKFAENEPIRWADVEPVLKGWASDFKQRFNAAHGR